MEAYKMNINVIRNAKQVTVQLVGRLDTATAPALDKTIEEQVGPSDQLTLDLAGLEYISSAGLRVLLGAQKKMKAEGSMTLTGVREEVMEVLEMTGFADILDIK